MSTRTVVAAGGNWNTAATWVEGAVPLATDDVVIDATSGNSTVDAAFAGTVASVAITAKASTSQLTLARNLTISGALTVNGTVLPIRQFITSNIIGTARTLSCGSVNLNMVDFRDITFAGTMTITAAVSVGDCGGNSGVNWASIVTAAAEQTWAGAASENVSTATWTSRVPLPHDPVVLPDSGAYTLTVNMPRFGAGLSFTGAGKLTLGIAITTYGNIDFTNAGTFTPGSHTWFVENRARTGTLNIISNAKTLYTLMIQAGVTVAILDSLSLNFYLTIYGTFTNPNNFNVTTGYVAGNGTLTTGAATITLTSTGTVWGFTGTLTATGSTIIINNVTSTAKAFAGAGKSFGAITWAGDNIKVTGNNNYTGWAINTAGLTTGLLIDDISTQTLSNPPTTNGSLGNLAKLWSDNAGSPFHLSLTSGIVSLDFLSLKDSHATGGATWYAGAGSDNVSGNDGWVFTGPPGYFPSNNMIHGQPFGGGFI